MKEKNTQKIWGFNRFLQAILTILALSVGSIIGADETDIVVVVNPINGNSLTQEQIRNIFLGKNREFPDGSEAVTVDQKEGSSIRDQFYSKVAGKTPTELKAYWANRIFTGMATPPTSVTNDDEVKKFIKDNRGGMGYIKKSSADSTVKVVTLDK